MPIRVGQSVKSEPEFRFHNKGENEERVYHLIQTVVRRIRAEGAPKTVKKTDIRKTKTTKTPVKTKGKKKR
jgi:hypothetical protein